MIAVFVTFDSDSLDEERVRKVAAEARGMFEGMPHLRICSHCPIPRAEWPLADPVSGPRARSIAAA